MSFNPKGAVAIPLDVKGSWVCEMAPDCLPPGVSPDNQDIIFVPGDVGSRPALQRVFQTPLPAGGPGNVVPTVVYGKSFVTPTGAIKNLYLDSSGTLWLEDPINSPGTYTDVFQTVPGSFCRSITAFGREYFAFSDGLHGSDFPLQYDGTNFDRVTQDGPGAPPTVSSVALPSSAMALSTGRIDNISDVYTASLSKGIYYSIIVQLTAPDTSLAVGQVVTLAGNTYTGFNTNFTINYVTNSTEFGCSAYFAAFYSGAGGTATFAAATLTRGGNNIVTATTATAHGLKPGYQAQIANVPAATVGGGIASIVVNNENQAGIATITTSSAHGLAPNSYVSITGVPDQAIGTAVTAWSLSVNALGQGILSITTSAAHRLQVGMLVNVSLNGGTVQELAVNSTPSTTSVTFLTVGGTTGTGTTNATLTLPFPLPASYAGNPNGSLVEVLSCPTTTTFQIAFAFEDATWTGGGAIYLAWDGTFYVISTPSTTSFTYQQYGPGAITTSVGTVIPWGQISPGLHQCRQFFVTRQGQITRPSPPVTFMANGGQYVSVTQMLTGPSNIVARGFEFTGAEGSYFFYIPVPAQVNGQPVSTATVINDNTTTSALFDFGDATLYSAQATSTPTNDIASQVVLDGALGFADYKQRLVAFGQRNTVNNFLNLGFEGGPLGSPPPGWTVVSSGGAVVAGRTPGVWQVTVGTSGSSGAISQSASQDGYGAPILQPNTLYKVRLWLEPSAAVNTISSITFTNESNLGTVVYITLASAPTIPLAAGQTFLLNGLTHATWLNGVTLIANVLSGGNVIVASYHHAGYSVTSDTGTATLTSSSIVGASFAASLTSASTGFSVSASIANSQMSLTGSYLEATFSAVTPLTIPSDLLLTLTANSGGLASTLTWDEVSIIDAESPYLDTELFGSYPDNPEAFSGVTGLFGPPDDTHKVMDIAIIRNTPYIVTQDPEGRLHQVTSGNTEPSGWVIAEVDSSCGALSAFCLTKSQSDNRSSSGGEEWFAWASMSGPRIFGGSIAHKIGQEIQPAWFDETNETWPQINMAAALTAWALNDPTTRTIYFGLPLTTATAPSIIYPLNYRELDSAEAIASSPPFHPSFAGRLIATDNTRKWTRWNLPINGAALMYRMAGTLSTVLFAGNAQAYGLAVGYGNIYTLNPTKYTDDDYGQIYPYYVTAALPDTGQEVALQLDSGRKLLAYLSAMVSAVAKVTVTALCDNLSNPWPLTVTRTPGTNPNFEMEWGGGNATAHRMFFKIASSPGSAPTVVSVLATQESNLGTVVYVTFATPLPYPLAAGQTYILNGLTNATWLNGVTLTANVLSGGNVLVAPYSHSGYSSTADTGTAILTNSPALTDNSFVLRKLTPWFKKAKLAVRGAAQ